jgi:hypothetical protein
MVSSAQIGVVSLDSLNSNVLLLIVEMLVSMEDECHSVRVWPAEMFSIEDACHAIIPFSMTKKRFRELCGPKFLTKIIQPIPAADFNQQLLDVQSNPIALNSIM